MISILYNQFLQNPIICTDTRNIQQGALFFALKGDNFNGNLFAQKALDEGCSYAVIDEVKYKTSERFILVEDALQALQQLANYHRKQLNIPILAITGSNGKTTSKELTNAVLSQKFKVLATKGNLNNHIGVPLTLLSITKEHEIAIVEMGANHQGEIADLCKIAEPTFGMITNIGKAHLEGFGGAEGVIKGKSEMYKHLKQFGGKLFVNKDNDLLCNLSNEQDRILYGGSLDADFVGKLISDTPFVSFKCTTKKAVNELDSKATIQSHLIGKYNYENMLAAACIGNYFGVSDAQIKQGIENYIPSNNRSQLHKTKTNELILDAYNANPSSMRVAIENFASIKATNKLVILGDMLELGEESAKEHQAIVDLLNEKQMVCAYLVGEHFNKINNTINALLFKNVDELVLHIKENLPTQATILIKGSRGIKLEKVVEVL